MNSLTKINNAIKDIETTFVNSSISASKFQFITDQVSYAIERYTFAKLYSNHTKEEKQALQNTITHLKTVASRFTQSKINQGIQFLQNVSSIDISNKAVSILHNLSIYVKTSEDADKIASAFSCSFGDTIVIHPNSRQMKMYVTIMDYLCTKNNTSKYHWGLLKNAFSNFGFKRAAECNIKYLRSLYLNSSSFILDHIIMKEEQTQFRKELLEYLFQPRLIQKWLDAGYNIEEYLM